MIYNFGQFCAFNSSRPCLPKSIWSSHLDRLDRLRGIYGVAGLSPLLSGHLIMILNRFDFSGLFLSACEFWNRTELRLTRDLVFALLATNAAYQFGGSIYHRGLFGCLLEWKQSIEMILFRLIRRIPPAERAIQVELKRVLDGIEHDLLPPHNLPVYTQLPLKGIPVDELGKLLQIHAELDDADVIGGRISGTVYGVDSKVKEAILMAYEKFLYSNPLHPDVFKATRKMEAELVTMTLKMFNGDEQCVGVVTFGGTESILLAILAYRNQAREERNILFPEIVVPVTGHAAFEKAASYFGVRLIQCEVEPMTGKAIPDSMRRCITRNTVALVASAPCYSLGVVDEVEGIAALAREYNIGCHVDCCLGSFILPQIAKMEEWSQAFDFRCPGVTSISCDPHKYGFGPKGTSVLMYRNPSLRHHQYFVTATWTGGIYASPTLAGSRSGAVVAATWAAMLNMGEEGYLQAAIQIRRSVARIIEAVSKEIPELFIYGTPSTSVVAFGSKKVNIYAVNDQMNQRGWHLNALQNPPAVHIACTLLTTLETVETLITDLKEALTFVLEHDGDKNLIKHGTAGIYGTSATLPDKSLIKDVAKGYIDILYKTNYNH